MGIWNQKNLEILAGLRAHTKNRSVARAGGKSGARFGCALVRILRQNDVDWTKKDSRDRRQNHAEH